MALKAERCKMLVSNFHKLVSFFKKQEIYFFGCYFFLFLVANYYYRLSHKSDSDIYWARSFDINKYEWLFFFKFNNHFMLFINYPFIKLGVPFWGGFLLYGIIGFWGICLFRGWALQVLNTSFKVVEIPFLFFLFWLPNMSIWIANLGKEALVFFGISACLYGSLAIKKYWYYVLIGGFLVVMIRPHVAFMWLIGFVVVVLFSKAVAYKLKVGLVGLGIFLCSFAFWAMLKITRVDYFSWGRIQQSNMRSLLYFKGSGSYVPMDDYPLLFKWFSFYFRPLFIDAHTVLSWVASIENFSILLLHLAVLFLLFKKQKLPKFPVWVLTIFLTAFIAALLFSERYANLGIFMRTKVMFQPFVLVALIWIWEKVRREK